MSERTLEIVAPAGDADCLKAAVGAGTDAVYFGLDIGLNARAKAPSFAVGELPRTVDFLHERGVKGYVTLNTLVFDSELDLVVELLAAISASGADAVIVQDLGVAWLARMTVPDLPLHASTQMTISSPGGAMLASELGARRVILPRELSLEEIRRFRAATDLELECFVHGALCVSYSGQCLASVVWGQRSANRGLCAQPCRLAYGLLGEGGEEPKPGERYLLSAKDIAAHGLMAELVAAGVSSFKIEGRYKGPDYVAGAVEKCRRALDAVREGRPPELGRADREELALTFSRGFSTGWLEGDDHQRINHGRYPGHRGLLVGHVLDVRGRRVRVQLGADAPDLKPGDWMIFGQDDPEGDEPKGGLFGIGEPAGGILELRFGEPGPDLGRVRPGDELWKSHDSAVKRRLLRYVHTERKVAVDVMVRGRAGSPLVVEAHDAVGRSAHVQGKVLERARARPLDEDIVRDKLATFGDTHWQLRSVRLELDGALATSPSALKRLRRELVGALAAQPLARPSRRRLGLDPTGAEPLAAQPPARATNPTEPKPPSAMPAAPAIIVPLCRTRQQVEAVLLLGTRELYLDFLDLDGLAEAVVACRTAGARVLLSTMRIEKPGEDALERRLDKLAPDGILIRHLGALEHYRAGAGPEPALPRDFHLHGDFSLNCSNALTGRHLLGLGLSTIAPSHDLDAERLENLARALPSGCIELTLHQHLPLYHTGYCLYAHHLSSGHNRRDCGRPCERHRVSLRDAKGLEHPVLVDVYCRNTVFNGQAQSAARHLSRLLSAGVRRLRVDLVRENAGETKRVLSLYRALLDGGKTASQVFEELGAAERYGITEGTLKAR